MFSFKHAIFCILSGLLAGYSFDKKKSDMVWIGIFIYPTIYSIYYVNFPYDSSWAIIAVIEVLAGHGIYKMGLVEFLGEAFHKTQSSTQSKKNQDEIKKNKNQLQRKAIWPTRNKVIKIINIALSKGIILVVALAIILWIADVLLTWIVQLFS